MASDSFASLLESFELNDESGDHLHAKAYEKIQESTADISRRANTDGWEHPTTLHLLNELVDLYVAVHLDSYAQALCARLRTAFGRTFPPSHRIHAQVNIKLANALNNQHQYSPAEENFRQAISIYDRIGVDNMDLEFATALSGLCHSLVEQRKLAEAEETLKQLLHIYTVTFGEDHKDTLATINRLAHVLEMNNKATEAVQLCSLSFTRCLQSLGEKDAITQQAAAALARLKRSLGELQEAEQIYRKAIAITAQGLGAKHITTLRLQHSLADLLLQRNDVEQADKLYRECLRDFELVVGESHPETLLICQSLGELYLQLQDPVTARAFLQRVYDQRCLYYQSFHHPLCYHSLFLLGKTYHVECMWRHLPSYRSNLQTALDLFSRSYQGLCQCVALDHPLAVSVALYLGEFYTAYEHFTLAEKVFDHLYTVFVVQTGQPLSSRTVDIIMQRAIIKEKDKKYVLACELYEQCVDFIAQLRRGGGLAGASRGERDGEGEDKELNKLEQEVKDHLKFARHSRDM